MRRPARFGLSNCMDEGTASIRFSEGRFARPGAAKAKSKDEEKSKITP
jgi:hypothetical protein